MSINESDCKQTFILAKHICLLSEKSKGSVVVNFYQHPPEYQLLQEKLIQLKKQYPFIRLFSIGKSVLGRKLSAVGIGNLKTANLLVGAFHGQEWLTASVLIRFIEDCCSVIAAKQQISGMNLEQQFAQKGVIVIPMLNPDGVEIALKGPICAKHLQKKVKQIQQQSNATWQANARGVDLNHNFDANFALCKQDEQHAGIFGPSPRQYGGEYPHSEPETKALVHLCQTFSIQAAFAFHSQGEEIYYQYGEHTPKSSCYIASLLAAYCGYTITKPTGTASHGGFKDWFIDKLHRPGFTLEIGKGVNPLPITDLPFIYQTLRETMMIAAII